MEICTFVEMFSFLLPALITSYRLHKRNHYDINHTHFIIPTGIVSYLLKKMTGLGYILTAHGSDVPGFNEDRFVAAHKFTAPFLRRITDQARYVTTPSQFLKDLIIETVGPKRSGKIKVIPNGCRDLLDKKIKKEPIIISSGRLLPRKGFQYLIEAFKTIQDDRWRLYIVGDGPYRAELEKRARGNENIIFTGWLDNQGEKYRELLNKAKIFVLVSKRESQGIVLLEAMSVGCAIITSNTSACRETVSSEVGYLVNSDDPEEVFEKLESLINGYQLDDFMSNSRKRYLLLYRWDAAISRYEKLLES